MSSQAVISVDLKSLVLVARYVSLRFKNIVAFLQSLKSKDSGKVREIYKIDESTLLMVVTDRVSAYDEILSNGIPGKGAILCQMSGTPRNPPSNAFSRSIYLPSPNHPRTFNDYFQESLIQLPVAYWFTLLGAQMPNFKHHVLSLEPPLDYQIVSPSERATLRGRCMQIQALRVFPIEVIVRGYLTGSAWDE